MLGLVQLGNPIAWAPPIVSVVVTLGFFVFVIILLFHGPQVNDVGAQIINVASVR